MAYNKTAEKSGCLVFTADGKRNMAFFWETGILLLPIHKKDMILLQIKTALTNKNDNAKVFR